MTGICLIFLLIFAGCSQPTDSGGFVSRVNDSVANNEATLGLVGTSAASNAPAIAAAAIEGGKIKITSLSEGAATITVSDSSEPPHTAAIPVTVTADGTIVIGAITKHTPVEFTVSHDETTVNDEATLGLVGATATATDTAIATAAIVGGRIKITSVSEGATSITVSDSSEPAHTAAIAVSVAADGTITIGTITKYTGVEFTASNDETTINDEATLGLVGTSATATDTGIATAATVGGRIKITSVSAGATNITVSDDSQPAHTATIAVTVATDGTITIGTITKYSGGNGFTASVDETTINDEATLGLIGTSVTATDNAIATADITDDKIKISSVSEGSTNILVFDGSGHSATIAVVIAADGSIVIEEIAKYYDEDQGEDPPDEELEAEPLPVPTGLRATVLSVNSIEIEWNPVEEASGYIIYWYGLHPDHPEDGLNWYSVTECEETSYVDTWTGFEPETTYRYAVYALDAQGNESGGTEVLEGEWVPVTTPAAPVPPAPEPEPEPDQPAAPILAPPVISTSTGITLTKNEQGVTVSWSAVDGATSYNIYRANTKNTPDHTKLNVSPIPASMTAYDDMTVNLNSIGTSYYYVVTAVNVDGVESAKSIPRGFTVTKPKVYGYNPAKSGDTPLWGCYVKIGSTEIRRISPDSYITGLTPRERREGHTNSSDKVEFNPGTYALQTRYKYYASGIKHSNWVSRPSIQLKALHTYRVNVIGGAVTPTIDLTID
jgi:hypothetical protein